MTGRSGPKPANSPSSESGVSSGSEDEGEWGKESEDEAGAECSHCTGLFSKYHDGEEWVRCPKMSKLGTSEKGLFSVRGKK